MTFPRYGPPGFATGTPLGAEVPPPPQEMAVKIRMTDKMTGMNGIDLFSVARLAASFI
nr:hypothetical protein [Candidatus Acidoferrales bacterium]